MSARWVYSWKSDEFGIVVRAKARLVARGLGQREGIDFFDTFLEDGAVDIACFFAC